MARKVVPEQFEHNRQKILDATIELMAKKSIAKLTLNDVAQKISMTKAAIYWYFPSRDILINEAANYLYTVYTKYAFEVAHSNGTPMDKLQRIFEGTHDCYEYQLIGLVPVKIYLDQYSENSQIKELIRKGYIQFYEAIEYILLEGIACGAFNTDLSPKELTVFLSGMIDGLAFQNILFSDDSLTVTRTTIFQALKKMLK